MARTTPAVMAEHHVIMPEEDDTSSDEVDTHANKVPEHHVIMPDEDDSSSDEFDARANKMSTTDNCKRNLQPEFAAAACIRNTATLDHVMEVFSPPRLVPAAIQRGLRGHWSLDLDTGWNLLCSTDQDRCCQLVESCRPGMLMLSPPCTMFSPLQRMWNIPKMDPAVFQSRMAAANKLLHFTVTLMKLQSKLGGGFCFEHPVAASSWQDPLVVHAVATIPDCQVVNFDQCTIGLRSPAGGILKKRTKLCTNMPAIQAVFLDKQCRCTVPHTRIQGSGLGFNIAAHAQVYPSGFVQALLNSCEKYLEGKRFWQ